MKKKVLLCLLAALLAMNLAACGGKNANNNGGNDQQNNQQHNQQDTAVQPEKPEDDQADPPEDEQESEPEDLPENGDSLDQNDEQTAQPDTGGGNAGGSAPEEGTVPAGQEPAGNDEPVQAVTGTDVSPAPSLSSFFDTLAASYEGLGALAPLEGELLDAYYPGLSALPVKEILVQETQMSMQNCAVALVTLSDDAAAQDIAAVQEIFSARIKTQAEGGAFYPASCEVWEKGVVTSESKTVGMFVYDGAAKEMADAFTDTFKN